jgi:hypothetical protein
MVYQAVQTMVNKADATNATGLATGRETVAHLTGRTQAMELIHRGRFMSREEEEDNTDPPQVPQLSNEDTFIDKFIEVKEQSAFTSSSNKIRVKGRLRDNISFYECIGASKFILSVIRNGYKLPFICMPIPLNLSNNRSARDHSLFVDEALSELLNSGRIHEVVSPPVVINPLSVSVQQNGKKRLILDLRHVNKCLLKYRFKYEDWKVAYSYFEKDAYMFSFDLKSGYHHIDIANEFQTYLGFSWKFEKSEHVRYFVFTVLPFGLSTAPYIFTKVVRPLESYWRLHGIKITIFLDDGLVIENNYESCKVLSLKIKHDLDRAGFVSNDEKSIWEPCQNIIWIGLSWNTLEGCIRITECRLRNFFEHIESIISNDYVISARQLSSFTGKIISTGAVVGNVSRIMTRHCSMSIVAAQDWDSAFKLDQYSVNEIEFWRENLSAANVRHCFTNNAPHCFIYSDASGTGCGAHMTLNQDYICHNMWSKEEGAKSSTWRELYAIKYALESFCTTLENSHVKWFTDNQGAAKIVEVGSMRSDLQTLALRIFQICTQYKILLDIQWVPRTEVTKADFISRIIDLDDWQITRSLFDHLENLWGPHSIDCFANHYNHKISRFYSRFWTPGCTGIDFFIQHLHSENCLLVPPVCLVSRTLDYMCQQKAIGTLVVPFWPSSSFWPLLSRTYAQFFADYRIFSSKGALEHGRNVNCLLGSKRFNGSILAVRLNFENGTGLVKLG